MHNYTGSNNYTLKLAGSTNKGQFSTSHHSASSQASLHQWLHCMSTTKQFFVLLKSITISYSYHAATDVGMFGKINYSDVM